MSARRRPSLHPESPQVCVFQAASCVAYRIGLVEVARTLLGTDRDDSIRRWIQAGTWPAADLIGLKRLERDVLGTQTIHDAEADALYGAPAGDATRVEREVSGNIGDAAQLIAEGNAMLADGRVDEAEITTYLPQLDAHITNCRRLAIDLRTRIGGMARGKGRR